MNYHGYVKIVMDGIVGNRNGTATYFLNCSNKTSKMKARTLFNNDIILTINKNEMPLCHDRKRITNF